MSKRKSISKKTRFEVFKRDSFKCQYCGTSAPEAVLEVDHINPVSQGGENEIINYITSCRACNSGKSDRKLSDNSTLAKQKAQLDELSDRREQVEMMVEWRNGLKKIDDMQIDVAADAWSSALGGASKLSDTGRKKIYAHIKKYGLMDVLDAIELAAERYVKTDSGTGLPTKLSLEDAFKKIGGILAIKSMSETEREIRYVNGILKNRMTYVPYDAIETIRLVHGAVVELDTIKRAAKGARNWTGFDAELSRLLELV